MYDSNYVQEQGKPSKLDGSVPHYPGWCREVVLITKWDYKGLKGGSDNVLLVDLNVGCIGVSTLWIFSKMNIYDMCTFQQVHYTLIKIFFLKKNHRKMHYVFKSSDI